MTTPDSKPDDPKPKAKAKKPGRWRRRTIVILGILVVLVLVFRAALTLLLPSVINKVARSYDLQCAYDRIDLHLLGGNADLWNFRVLPLEGGDPILRADYLQGDISVAALLKGRLVVYRAAADGVDVSVEREADGSIPLLARFVSKSTIPPPAKASANPTTQPDLEPPLRVDALRLEHIRARFHDLSVQPNVDTRLALDLRLSDLGIVGQPAHFELDFSSDPILDVLRVEGRATTDPTQLSATLNVFMRGLHLKPAEGYLTAFGIRPTADNISATMTGTLTASINPNPNAGINADLKLDNARLAADGSEAAALDHLEAVVHSITAGSANITKVDLTGVRASASRNADGNLAFAGVELVPPTPTTEPTPTLAPAATPTTTTPFQVTLDTFSLNNLRVGFTDQFVSPPVTLALNSKQIQITDPNNDSTRDIEVDLASPGLVQDILLKGQATLADPKTVAMKIDVTGINPTAIKPYLDANGLTSEWRDGTLSLGVNSQISMADTGKLTASADLENLHLADNGTDLLAFDKGVVKNAALDPQSRTISIGAIEAHGPGLTLHRDADGKFHVFGFKIVKTTRSSPQVEPTTQPSASPTTPTPLPFDNFQLTQLKWDGGQLQLHDDAISPPANLSVGGALELDNITLHLHKTGVQPQRGKFAGSLYLSKTAGFNIGGVITPSPEQTTCDFKVHGNLPNINDYTPYLKPLGIEPVLKNGSLDLHGKLNLDTAASTPKISLSFNDLKYANDQQLLISVGALAVNGLTTTPTGLALDSVTVQSPHARILRRADGTLEAAGFHVVATPPAPQPATDPPPVASAPPSAPSNFTAALNSLKVSDAGVDWIDNCKRTQTTLTVDADLNKFAFAPDAKPAPFDVTATVAGSVDSLKATGNIAASTTAQSLSANVDATGLRLGPAAAYLPPNILGKLKNGTFHTTIAADVSQNPKGGQAINLTVKDLSYGDTTNVASLFSFDSLHIAVPRLDPADNVVTIDDLTLTGLQTSARKTSAGIDLLGLELASSAQPADPPPAPKSIDPPPAPPAPPTTSPSAQAALRQVAAQRAKLPYVTLRNLDINAQSISVFDDTKPNAKPLVVSNLRLHNPATISLLGKDPESNAPTEISLTGRLDPIADNFSITTRAVPFSVQKTLNVDLLVSGIQGQGLVDTQPDLAPTIDGSQLKNGQLSASLAAALKLQTVRPTDFDFSYGGKLDFSLKDLAFRAEPSGPVQAGIGEIHSEGIVLSPNLAGIDVRELEIDNITGRGVRKTDGIHVCGLILKTQTTQPTTQPSPAIAAAAPTPPPPSAKPAPVSPPPSSEYKIDRLLVSGMDFRVEDQTCTPPAIIPINALDLEAQNLSSLATVQDKPIRFNFLASADKVPLQQANSTQAVNRELFSQVAGSGVVSLYPNLKGWTKLSLNGFELTGVRGIAEEEKVNLGGGTFDADIDLRFPGDGSADTSTKFVLTDLAISEPPNGFISRTLKLNAPLDLVISVLQDQDGSITIPLNVPIQKGEINTTAVVGSGVGALGEIIATAIASSPLKVANLFGLGSKPDTQPPVVIAFPPGYSALGDQQFAQLNDLAKRLRKDKNLQVTLRCDSGKDDVTLAQTRVNPDATDALTLATALSRRRAELLAVRREAAAQVRAWLASNDTENTARGIERLRNIDRQLADTEDAMDHAYDLLRPGADRQAMRRTRAATLAVARSRLQTVQTFLEGTGKDAVAPDRIHLTNPQFSESPPNDTGTITATVVKTK